MPNIDDLHQYVASNNAKGFILCYMKLVEEGLNLPVPTYLEYPKTKEGWEEILPEVTGGYTDDFVDALTNTWLALIKKQGGKLTPTFTKEIIALIEGKTIPKALKNSQINHKIQKSSGSEKIKKSKSKKQIPSQETISENAVSSQISSDYYSEQNVRNTQRLNDSQISKHIEISLSKENADSFLIAYLSKVRNGHKIKIPLTSVLANIKVHWEEIIMSEFGYRPSADFLKAITSTWFFLVNHMGLPTNDEKLEEFLYYLMSKHHPLNMDSENTKIIKMNFIDKIKKLFGF